MGQESIPSELTAQGDDIPPFRLRTAHFFVLTTVCAIVGAIRINWIDWQEVPNDAVGPFRLYVVFASLLFGAAFTALLILLGRRWRFGRSELQSPGHWLLVFVAVAALIQGATEVLLQMYRYGGDSPNVGFDVWNLEKLLRCSGVGVTCFVFAWLMPGSLWWKSAMVIAGSVMLALVPQHLLVLQGTWRPWFPVAHVYASLGVSMASLPLLLLACWSDARQNAQRDWLHWAGVLIVAIAAGSEGCYALYSLWKM